MAFVNLYCDSIIYFFEAFIGIAAPVTDVLTAVLVYYRHKDFIWFGMSIGFATFPAILFLIMYVGATTGSQWSCLRILKLATFGNPLAPGLYRLKLLISSCIKKEKPVTMESVESEELVNNDKTVEETNYEANLGLIASIFQAMPQIILQSYAIFAVSNRDVQPIQIVSLSVTFLNFFLGITIWELNHIKNVSSIRLVLQHKIVTSVGNFLLLSGRMLAVVSFTYSFSYWLMCCLFAHWFVWIALDWIFARRGQNPEVRTLVIYYFFPLFLLTFIDIYSAMKASRRFLMAVLYHILYAVTNLVVILAFYYSESHSNEYKQFLLALVAITSILGALLKIALQLRQFIKRCQSRVAPA